MHKGQYYLKPAAMDPKHSVSVMEHGRRNEFNEPYCVAAAVTRDEGQGMVDSRNAEWPGHPGHPITCTRRCCA